MRNVFGPKRKGRQPLKMHHSASNDIPVFQTSRSRSRRDAKPIAGLVARWRRYRGLLGELWWIPLLTVSAALAAGACYMWLAPPKFLSIGRMMVSGRILLPEGAVYSEEAANFYGTQIELMQSESVRLAAEALVQALDPDLKPVPVKIQASQQQHASIFALRAIGDQPEYTRALLDACMREYINQKKEMRTEKSDTTLTAITDQLRILEKEISAGGEELKNFEKENNIDFLQKEGNSAGDYLNTIDNKLAALDTEYQLFTRLTTDQNIDRQLAAAAASTPSSSDLDSLTGDFGSQADYSKAKQQIELLGAKLADFSKSLRPKHPFIVKLKNDIVLQEELIAIYHEQSRTQLAAQRESCRLQIENLQTERKEWSVKALDLSWRTAEYGNLKSKLDRSQALYDHLLSTMQSVGINKSIDQDVVSILEKASPGKPVKAGLVRVIGIALVAGLIFGIAIFYIIDQLDDRLITIGEYQFAFTERILGNIPAEPAARLAPIGSDDSRNVFAESFSNLRSSLLYLPYKEGAPRSLLITSAAPNDGKSTVASNLACTLAFGGSSVLLIDGDLRRGRLHGTFDIPNDRGFSEVLTREIHWTEAARATRIEQLTVMPRGKPLLQPGKYLLGNVMSDLFEEIYGKFELVLFDSCPILAADDTTTLAPRLDATLFVVRMASTTTRAAQNALKLLYDRQANVIGVVLNAVDTGGGEYGYCQYSDYYQPAETRKA